MFKRILVPVDGSELSERAIHASISLACQLHASITGFVAVPLLPVASGPRALSLQELQAQAHDGISTQQARAVLAHFADCAREAGVDFEGYHDEVARIDRAIIAAAESRGCDMILMVTHGRGAFGEFLYGSQTKAVLAGSDLPLLVLH